jgi:transcriptional regulator with XRE-family HTH domain
VILLGVESFYVDLGRRLRVLRDRKRLTQQQLGARLEPPVTRASIANIETGKQRVLAHTLLQLADAVGVSLGELLPQSTADASETLRDELQRKLGLSDHKVARLAQKLGPEKKRAR